ncbi:MAG: undecaprenyldiphospho-muramoylpentapeptide beta-N-acetylglucosaminyltransferase [Marinilabiliales bacterium]|nr:MAG: undecaprenyldiphospho-muramoylpentapeptide beta-N-acetylglucosaminyltransferase [Marinilabiliales bacterium]
MKNQQKNNLRIIISGGGTGGHIFPAIAIANALKRVDENIEILFVGANGRMEMEKVPAAGYDIKGLPITGLQRKLSFKNVILIFKLLASLSKAKRIIRSFKPHAAVGVGGYASGPVLRVAEKKGIPCLIQEQNSFPGVTNKLLAKNAKKICVAYEGMDRFFPKEKIIITGNPVRQDLVNLNDKKEDGLRYFGLAGNKRILLIVGGSLGARTLNESLLENLDELIKNKVQVIWQTGKSYFKSAKDELSKYNTKDVKIFDFIARMDLAYSVADLVVSRAGAITISELCIVRKPAILVPSPNVSEDHQTKNAMALINLNAAMMVSDADAKEKLVGEAIKLIKDDFRLQAYIENISKMAVKNSADIIANEILEMINK